MWPPNWPDVLQISKELGFHPSTLYQWSSNWRLQGEVVPASETDPDSWSAADKLTVVLETARFNATELSSYCRERCLFAEWLDLCRQTALKHLSLCLPMGAPRKTILNFLCMYVQHIST